MFSDGLPFFSFRFPMVLLGCPMVFPLFYMVPIIFLCFPVVFVRVSYGGSTLSYVFFGFPMASLCFTRPSFGLPLFFCLFSHDGLRFSDLLP